MRVAINRCYGGFSVSYKALIELIQLDAPCVMKYPAEDWWIKLSNYDIDCGGGYFGCSLDSSLLKDGWTYHFDRSSEFRTDPKLLGVIDRLGLEANEKFAEIKIIDIPDDVNWEIDEDDGLETIREVSRSRS